MTWLPQPQRQFFAGWLRLLPGLLPVLVMSSSALAAHPETDTNPPPPVPTSHRQPGSISQALSRPVLQQGTQVMLNGRSLPTAWSQWQLAGAKSARIGITDRGLSQLMGVDLLNTANPAQQPVQWFSDPVSTPLLLLTRIVPPLRYLDITDLAQRLGWQMQVQGTVLQISSPAAKVLALRQGKQPWGDRIVLDLDRPAPWQLDEATDEFVVNLDAALDPAIAQRFTATPGNQFQTLKLETSANQTRLRLGTTVRPRVWSLATPNRLIIDVRPDTAIDQDIQWAPGLRQRQQIVTLGANRFPVLWLEANPRQPGVAIQPILPNAATLVGTAPLFQTARQAQATAAVNGGFFNRNNQLPLGAIRQGGRWLSGPILGRGAIAWDMAGTFKIARLTLQETITTPTNQAFPLTHLNSAYLQAGIARYTADWGPTYTTLTDNEIIVTVENNQVTSQQTAAAVGATTVPLPANGYLLVLRSNQAAATNFTPGKTLRLERTVTPPEFDRFPNLIAGGPLLVQNRQIVLDAAAEKFSKAFINEQAARSAIGITPSGNVIIATVHARIGGGGASLNDMAQIMLQLGVTDALNLDGGSSTTLYLGGQIIDRLPSTAARVHDGIGIFIGPDP